MIVTACIHRPFRIKKETPSSLTRGRIQHTAISKPTRSALGLTQLRMTGTNTMWQRKGSATS